ncbi:hypothetical protein V1478_006346 [Vespula squamosa]|uniref:Uncharacterized protein n=1 Tax=Vespula squamosa TaxID=30214 RepID=A0ABD2B7M4_VESSQ
MQGNARARIESGWRELGGVEALELSACSMATSGSAKHVLVSRISQYITMDPEEVARLLLSTLLLLSLSNTTRYRLAIPEPTVKRAKRLLVDFMRINAYERLKRGEREKEEEEEKRRKVKDLGSSPAASSSFRLGYHVRKVLQQDFEHVEMYLCIYTYVRAELSWKCNRIKSSSEKR